MAAKSGRKPAPKGKRTAKKNQKDQSNIKIAQEMLFLFSLAFTILLFLCNFKITNELGEKTSIIGGFGNVLSHVMCGIFGIMAYIAPLLLFVGILFGISNKGKTTAAFKLGAGTVLFFLCTIVAALISGLDNCGETVAEYYEFSMLGKGGGVIGGVLGNGMHSILGMVGTIVVVLILFIMCLVILTEKSFMRAVKKSSQRVYETARDDADRRLEQARLRREQQQQERKEKKEKELRMNKKVSGVAMDTKLKKEAEPSQNIHEITIKEEEQIALDALNNIKIKGIGFENQQTAEDVAAMTEDMPAPAEEAHILGSGSLKKTDTKENVAKPEKAEEQPKKTEAKPKIADMQVFSERSQAGERQSLSGKQFTDSAPIKKQEEQSGEISKDMMKSPVKPNKKYEFPPLKLLKKGENGGAKDTERQLKETALHLQQTLQTFGVKVTITDISQGPSVTRYELQPEQGVKVSKIVNLSDDIKLNLAATDIRIEAPIPGKAAVGIEVPNKENSTVAFRDLIESKEFKEFPSPIAFAVGKDIAGKTVVTDIAKMPHLLIAGATGSGKSVCINTLIMSILYKAHPDEVKLIMVDPKVVELSVYNGIPHLMIPVVTDPKKASAALHWGVVEMEERYKKFADFNVRDLKGYNKKVEEMEDNGGQELPQKMPQIVIIVDELADLMMVCPGEVEESICRLAQLARAAGIHLIIATQRPSVDVITGLIKANMPSRIAFSVSSGVDSRTILDMNGAEKLLGKGDMLFYPQGLTKPSRVQGAFVSDQEVSNVVDFLKEQCVDTGTYAEEVEEKITNIGLTGSGAAAGADGGNERDAYFEEAGKFIIEKEKASIGMLQRVFKIGFNRAARIMDQLSEVGVVGEEEGTKPRKVLMSMEQFEQLLEEL
ncbi:MAG: DNA translocase FtsK [Roseburia sp.]|nr:DNA translocase FtsK [Roseburia sp.]MCM1278973.1 DNA translocase FtsK [Robinsoniella sp.]